MKRRFVQPDAAPADALDALCDALLTAQSRAELRALLVDLCTPAELEALSDRWHVVPLLLDGVPYREIHDRTAVSVTTIGRVSRCLTHGEGGYRAAAERLGLAPAAGSVAPDAAGTPAAAARRAADQRARST